MADGWQIKDLDGKYFVTFTVVGWADLFIRKSYKDVLVEHFKHYRGRFGLKVHAYVIMSNHVHAILSCKDYDLRKVIGWWKLYTAKKIFPMVLNENESRRNWLIQLFEGEKSNRNKGFQIWQNGSHPIHLYSESWIKQKLNYIHQNPVKEGIVAKGEYFLYSSAGAYNGRKGILELDLLFK